MKAASWAAATGAHSVENSGDCSVVRSAAHWGYQRADRTADLSDATQAGWRAAWWAVQTVATRDERQAVTRAARWAGSRAGSTVRLVYWWADLKAAKLAIRKVDALADVKAGHSAGWKVG